MISKIKALLIKIKAVRDLYSIFQNRKRNIYKRNKQIFINKRGVEIGGPTKIFKSNGSFPIYPLLKSLDNINFSNDNFWSTIQEGNNYIYESGKIAGRQIIAEGMDLRAIQDNSYNLMLSSHVLEHIANPIKALKEWRRVIEDNGYLVIILPDMRYTYDRKRPLTKF